MGNCISLVGSWALDYGSERRCQEGAGGSKAAAL